jgi:DNA-binding transcriptional ArsR family regulator
MMSAALKQLLWYLIAGTRGGVNRARIIETLHGRPYNAHQLGEALGLDYRTIRHHLDLLVRNGLLTRPAGDAYAAPYFLSTILEANYAVFEEIRRHVAPGAPDGRGGEGTDRDRETRRE